MIATTGSEIRWSDSGADTWSAQSLADGSLGGVLADVELALSGELPWSHVAATLDELGETEPDTGPWASLFYGVPAVVFVRDTATANGYLHPSARQTRLDAALAKLARRRLDTAVARQKTGSPLTTEEYGLEHGLVGLGVVLMRRARASEEVRAVLNEVLRYLVDLARPVTAHGLNLPGWYVPGTTSTTGLAWQVSNSMPDGAAGLLAFFALSAHAGHHVEGHQEAMRALLDWFALTRQETREGAWWPTEVTPEQIPDLLAGRPLSGPAPLPSWSGLAGIARAVQMGASIIGDRRTMALAEAVIASCLAPQQLRRLTEPGIRDGIAGLYQVARRAAAGSATLTHRTAAAGDILRDLVAAAHRHPAGSPAETGLMTGTTGLRLASQTMRRVNGPASVWDTCLLIA